MSERYSRLYGLPQNLYAVGSPVVIAAGTLLKDNQTGNVVAQLKFHSISDKIVKVVKVKLDLFDTAGSPIAESVVFDYLDLSASRDAEFGQKTPVPVPDNKVRSYNAAVTEVVFGDKSVWTATGEVWEQLSNPVPLAFGDPELLKQYQLRFGSNSKYTPKEEKGLWHCTCGALNHTGENCHLCRHSLFELQTVDMGELEAEKVARLAKEAKEEAEAKVAADIQKRKNQKTAKIVIAAVCAIVAVVVLMVTVVIPTAKEKAEQKRLEAEYAAELALSEAQYSEAVALMEAGEYEEAIAAFEALGEYKDSTERIVECNIASKDAVNGPLYTEAESLCANGEVAKAAIAFGKLGDYKDSHERSMELWSQVENLHTISAGGTHIVAIKTDGTVVAAGNNENGQCEVAEWTDIVSVSAGQGFTVGLRKDGTVVAVGYNDSRLDVGQWQDVVSIETGFFHTLGITADGKVYSAGGRGVSGSDNVQVCGAYDFTVAIKSNGTVELVGSENSTKCNVSGWKDMVSICAGAFNILGLKEDGTVVLTGQNQNGQDAVENWKDIVSISAGGHLVSHAVGLKSDGTVVAAGLNNRGQCDVSSWKNIVAVEAGGFNTVGLKADGTIVIIGDNEDGQLSASNWTNIKLPN